MDIVQLGEGRPGSSTEAGACRLGYRPEAPNVAFNAAGVIEATVGTYFSVGRQPKGVDRVDVAVRSP